jgi:hypothetical protein
MRRKPGQKRLAASTWQDRQNQDALQLYIQRHAIFFPRAEVHPHLKPEG